MICPFANHNKTTALPTQTAEDHASAGRPRHRVVSRSGLTTHATPAAGAASTARSAIEAHIPCVAQ